MLLGTLLMLVGVLLVISNKRIAVLTGTLDRHHFDDLGSSVSRQNIAIIGGFLLVAGFGAFLFL